MLETIYIEEEVKEHPRVKRFLSGRNPRVIYIERYTEIFNRKAQNFRLQKQNPALIIAKKYGNYLHPTPEKFSIGGKENYYFSTVLNCPFDCSYCFLQGMFRSAYYVWFVNYEDFQQAIEEKIKEANAPYFFSGYDSDSLAMEGITHFAEEFLPFFEGKKGFLEFRTKSINIRPLLQREPLPNCIAAFTLSPKIIAKEKELKAPPFEKRLDAAIQLQKKGWQIGLRFDPLIYHPEFENLYGNFFEEVFKVLSNIHSVTVGVFRLPPTFQKNMERIGIEVFNTADDRKEKMLSFCREKLLQYLPEEKLFFQ